MDTPVVTKYVGKTKAKQALNRYRYASNKENTITRKKVWDKTFIKLRYTGY